MVLISENIQFAAGWLDGTIYASDAPLTDALAALFDALQGRKLSVAIRWLLSKKTDALPYLKTHYFYYYLCLLRASQVIDCYSHFQN